MAYVTRLGDLDTGHDDCPPTALQSASTTVFANGRGVGRVGDSYVAHACRVHGAHSGIIAAGSSTVNVDGRAAGRIGDAVSCGGSVMHGSGNVQIGD